MANQSKIINNRIIVMNMCKNYQNEEEIIHKMDDKTLQKYLKHPFRMNSVECINKNKALNSNLKHSRSPTSPLLSRKDLLQY